MELITQARELIQEVRQGLRKEVICPCCDRLVKLYKRNLNAGQAVALIKLYRAEGETLDEFIAVSSLPGLRGGDYGKLKHWGLIAAPPENYPKRGAGLWRTTELGSMFVEGKAIVPKWLKMIDNVVIEVSPEYTDVKEALGKKFDYDELMRG